MNLNEKQRRIVWEGIKYISLLTIGVLVFLLGIASNNIAVWSNDNKMPALFGLADEMHSAFYSISDPSVNFVYLTDLFYFHGMVYSIGDIFIFLGAIFTLVVFFYGGGLFIYKSSKIKKEY